MLRCYTLGRADEAVIDEILSVEEQIFPFDGVEVLPLREVHVCRVGIGLCNHPLYLAAGGTFGSERGRLDACEGNDGTLTMQAVKIIELVPAGHCHVNRVGPQRPAWIPWRGRSTLEVKGIVNGGLDVQEALGRSR